MTPVNAPTFPQTIYGVEKVFDEGLGNYYFLKYGVDFRALRYPSIISSQNSNLHGTGSYITEIFFDLLANRHYTCYLKPDTILPAIHIDDTVEASLRMIKADRKKLRRTSYNLGGIPITPETLIAEVKKIMPFEFTVSYEIDPLRQAIADSWPDSMDDKETREDCFGEWLYIDDIEKLANHIYHQIDQFLCGQRI